MKCEECNKTLSQNKFNVLKGDNDKDIVNIFQILIYYNNTNNTFNTIILECTENDNKNIIFLIIFHKNYYRKEILFFK